MILSANLLAITDAQHRSAAPVRPVPAATRSAVVLETAPDPATVGPAQRLRTPRSPACAAISAFSLSLVGGALGAPTPVAAVTDFARRNPGHADVDAGHRWTTVTSSPDSAELRDGAGASLDAIRMPNHTWFIISGEACART